MTRRLLQTFTMFDPRALQQEALSVALKAQTRSQLDGNRLTTREDDDEKHRRQKLLIVLNLLHRVAPTRSQSVYWLHWTDTLISFS